MKHSRGPILAPFVRRCAPEATNALRQKLGEELKPHFSGKGTIRFDAAKGA